MGLELLLGAGLGFLILGPKRMHEVLGRLGRYKVQFDRAKRGITAQLAEELGKDGAPGSTVSEGPRSVET